MILPRTPAQTMHFLSSGASEMGYFLKFRVELNLFLAKLFTAYICHFEYLWLCRYLGAI